MNCPDWFDPGKNAPHIEQLLAYIRTFFTPELQAQRHLNGLLLHGGPGVGKTAAALSLLYEWGDPAKNRLCAFQSFSGFMVKIRSSWRKDALITSEGLHEEMMRPALLCLDDVGKRSAPEDQETLSTIVSDRIDAGRPTILTTNCMLGESEGIEKFCAACDSRILERFSGLDLAVEGQNQRRQDWKK